MLLRNFIIGSCLVSLIGAHAIAQETANIAVAGQNAPEDVGPAIDPLVPNSSNTFGETVAGHYLHPNEAITIFENDLAHQLLGEHGVDQNYHAAIEKYRKSEADSDAREEAKNEIQKALGEQYDAYLKGQEVQLDAMEKKLVELREQLKQRKSAKQKMVDLKFEMVLAQLEGLGWPENDGSWGRIPARGRYFPAGALGGQLNLLTTEPALAPESPMPPRVPGLRGEGRAASPRNRGPGR